MINVHWGCTICNRIQLSCGQLTDSRIRVRKLKNHWNCLVAPNAVYWGAQIPISGLCFGNEFIQFIFAMRIPNWMSLFGSQPQICVSKWRHQQLAQRRLASAVLPAWFGAIVILFTASLQLQLFIECKWYAIYFPYCLGNLCLHRVCEYVQYRLAPGARAGAAWWKENKNQQNDLLSSVQMAIQ